MLLVHYSIHPTGSQILEAYTRIFLIVFSIVCKKTLSEPERSRLGYRNSAKSVHDNQLTTSTILLKAFNVPVVMDLNWMEKHASQAWCGYILLSSPGTTASMCCCIWGLLHEENKCKWTWCSWSWSKISFCDTQQRLSLSMSQGFSTIYN